MTANDIDELDEHLTGAFAWRRAGVELTPAPLGEIYLRVRRRRQRRVAGVVTCAGVVVAAVVVGRTLPMHNANSTGTSTVAGINGVASTTTPSSSSSRSAPAGAEVLSQTLTTESTVAAGSMSIDQQPVQWSVVVRTNRARSLSGGFCVDVRPDGGSMCANGTDGTLGPILQAPSSYALFVVTTPPGATSVEVEAATASTTVPVTPPFSDSTIGFAVVAMSGADVRLTAHDITGGVLATASVPGNDSTAATVSPPPTTGYASSAEWRDRGDQIRADQAANAVRGGYDPVNKGDFAYLSNPVDVTAPGTYDLTFTVDNQFDPPNNPQGFAVNAPPDTPFLWNIGNTRIDVENGARTFHVELIVENPNFHPYLQFSIWIS